MVIIFSNPLSFFVRFFSSTSLFQCLKSNNQIILWVRIESNQIVHTKKGSRLFSVSAPSRFREAVKDKKKHAHKRMFHFINYDFSFVQFADAVRMAHGKKNNIEIIVMTWRAKCIISISHPLNNVRFSFHSFIHSYTSLVRLCCIHFPFNQMKSKEKKNFCAIIIGTWRVINKMHYSYSLLSFDAKHI